jgi:hypothetical protein
MTKMMTTTTIPRMNSTMNSTRISKIPTRRRVYRRRKQSSRRPAAGLLQPRQRLAVVISPPLQPHEQPVVLTPNAGDIALINAADHQVLIHNQTDRIVGYVVAIVPRAVVQIATLPWRKIASDIGQAFRENAVLQRLLRKRGV